MMSFIFSAVSILHVVSSTPTQRVKLVGGENEGRLEVYYKDEWGTVCDDRWNKLAASIVCKQLNKGLGEVLPKGTYPPGTNKIWMDEVKCIGPETSIFQCQSQPYGQTDCKHSDDVAIRCLGGSGTNCPTSKNEIRLVGSNVTGIGTVEINNQGTWGTICDDFWDLQDAKVVCRQLCFNETYALPGANKKDIEDNKTPVMVNRIDCIGTEGKIKQCPNFEWGPPGKCKYIEAASVTCVYQDNAAKKAPSAKLVCTDTDMTAIFRRSADPSLEAKNLHVGLNHINCNPVRNENITFVSITVPVSECGMTVKTNSTHIIYHLILWYLPPKIKGDIIRRNTYRHNLSCAFPRKGEVTQKPWNPQSPRTVAVTEKSTGAFVFVTEFYRESTFGGKITKFPFLLPLGAWLNVAVFLKTEQNNLKIIVPSCWVTPSADRKSKPKYVLFSKKCPVDQLLSLVQLNQTTLGFRFQTFTFNNNHGPLYVHCDTFVCLQEEKTEECDQSCGFKNRRRKRSDASRVNNMIYHVTSEPFLVNDSKIIKTDRIQMRSTTSTSEKETLGYITLPQRTHRDQLNVYTTEKTQLSITNQAKASVSKDRGTTATDSITNTVRTGSRTQSFTRSTIRATQNAEALGLSNDRILTTTIASTLMPGETTLYDIGKSGKELKERGEFAGLKKNTLHEISSKASDMKNILHLRKLSLMLIVLWCLDTDFD